MRQPQARKHQVCDHCGRRFGMVTHRWWGGKFCKRTCKDAYLREVTLDRETIRRWFCPQVSRAAQAVGGAALWAQSMTSSVEMIGRLAGGISRKNMAATTIAMTGCYIIVTTLTMALLHRFAMDHHKCRRSVPDGPTGRFKSREERYTRRWVRSSATSALQVSARAPSSRGPKFDGLMHRRPVVR
jgi:hypothetical protein